MIGAPDFDSALAELSDGPPPTDLADLALHTARRHVRRTKMLTVAGAVTMVAVLGLTATALRVLPRHVQAGAPPTARKAILSYEIHSNTSTSSTGPTYAWDPGSRSYVRTVRPVRPSPDGKWGLVEEAGLVGIAPWADAVHMRNLRWRSVAGLAKWSPSGQVIVADGTHKATTWISPDTMRAASVRWPAALRDTQGSVFGFGGLADDTVVYWMYLMKPLGYTSIVWTDRAGLVVKKGGLATSLAEVNAHSGYASMETANPSPDGRYINLTAGLVVDTQGGRVLYALPAAVPVGWYSANTVVFSLGSSNPTGNMILAPYLVSGAPLTPTRLDRLPGYSPRAGFPKLYVAAIGPGTEGAITF